MFFPVSGPLRGHHLFAIGALQWVTHCEVSDIIGQFGWWQARTLRLTADQSVLRRKTQLGGCTKVNQTAGQPASWTARQSILRYRCPHSKQLTIINSLLVVCVFLLLNTLLAAAIIIVCGTTAGYLELSRAAITPIDLVYTTVWYPAITRYEQQLCSTYLTGICLTTKFNRILCIR